MLFRHCVRGAELAFDQAVTVDDLVCRMLSAAVHDLRHTRARRAHQHLSQYSAVSVGDSCHLLLPTLKHDPAPTAKPEKSEVQR